MKLRRGEISVPLLIHFRMGLLRSGRRQQKGTSRVGTKMEGRGKANFAVFSAVPRDGRVLGISII